MKCLIIKQFSYDKTKKINKFSSLSHFHVCYSNFTNIGELNTLEVYEIVLSEFYPLRNKKVEIKVIPHEYLLKKYEKYEKYHIKEVKILDLLCDFFLHHFIVFSLKKPLVIVTELMEK
jgi:hypothetical protein